MLTAITSLTGRLRRRWIGFLLWLNNICPEHGLMTTGSGLGGRYYYCQECADRYKAQAADDLAQLRKEYNDATKP